MRALWGLILAFLLALPVWAEDLPRPQSTTVNDFAGLLGTDDAAALARRLSDLAAQTGVQGTVVTLPDRARYGTDGLEAFATRLFNQWAVGRADRKDGFMVLVLAQNREARIELGAGYPADADILAQDIMRNTMLPAFRDGQLSRGIRDGTEAVITLIARPHARGEAIAAPRRSMGDRLIGFGVFTAFGAILFAIARRHWQRRRCPQCGKTGIETTTAAQEQPQPDGSVLIQNDAITRRCPHCGWRETRLRPLATRSLYGPAGVLLTRDRNPDYRAPTGGGGGGFGGGSSSGGGASGRW